MTHAGGVFGPSSETSSETRTLRSISKQPTPDVNTDFVELIAKHNAQIKYLAQNQVKLQKGVDRANESIIQEFQDFIASVVELFSGGQLTAKGGLDFGDLQYILPAIGALLGFGDGPFPINLFQAASKFFLGYVVPTQQWIDEVNHIITRWMTTFGIDKDFIDDLKELNNSIGDIWDSWGQLFTSVKDLFTELGIEGGDLGPLGQVLAPIIKLFTGFDLSKFGNIVEFITAAVDPWIEDLTGMIDQWTRVIKAFAGGIEDLAGILNLGALFSAFTDLTKIPFSPLNTWDELFNGAISELETFADSVMALIREAITVVFPNLLSSVPWTAITQTSPNLLWNPDFVGAGSINGNPSWTWDHRIYRATPGQNKSKAGAARAIADGNGAKMLLSNSVAVGEGQTLDCSVDALSLALASSVDKPVELTVVTEAGETLLDSTRPNGDNAGWVNAPTGSAAAVLSGQYAVPDGVTSMRLGLRVDESTTAGMVWFDAAKVELSGGFLRDLWNLVTGLFGTTPLQAIETFLENLASHLGWSEGATGVADVFNIVKDLFGLSGATTISTFLTNLVGDIETLVNWIIDNFEHFLVAMAGGLGWNEGATAIRGVFDVVKTWLGFSNSGDDPLSNFLAKTDESLSVLVGWVADRVGHFLGSIATWLGWPEGAQGIEDVFNIVKSLFDLQTDPIQAVEQLFVHVAGWLGAGWAVDGIKGVFQIIETWFGVDNAGSNPLLVFLSNIADDLQSVTSIVADWIATNIGGLLEAFAKAIGWTEGAQAIEDVFNIVKSLFDLKTNPTDAIEQFFVHVAGWLGAGWAVADIKSLFGLIHTWFGTDESGSVPLTTFLSNVAGYIGALIDWVETHMTDFLGAVASHLGWSEGAAGVADVFNIVKDLFGLSGADTIYEFLENLSADIATLQTWIAAQIAHLLEALANGLGWPEGAQIVEDIFNAVKDNLTNVQQLSGLWTAVLNFVHAVLTSTGVNAAWNALLDALDPSNAPHSSDLSGIWDLVGNMIDSAADYLTAVFDDFTTIIDAVLSGGDVEAAFTSLLTDLGSTATGTWQGTWNTITDTFLSSWTNADNYLVTLTKAVNSFVQALLSGSGEAAAFNALLDAIDPSISHDSSLGGMWDFIGNMISGTDDYLTTLFTAVQNWVNAVLLGQNASSEWNAVLSALLGKTNPPDVTSVWDWIVKTFLDPTSNADNYFTRLSNALNNWITAIFDGQHDAAQIQTLWLSLLDALDPSGAPHTSAVGALWDFVANIIAGASDYLTDLWTAGSALVDAIFSGDVTAMNTAWDGLLAALSSQNSGTFQDAVTNVYNAFIFDLIDALTTGDWDAFLQDLFGSTDYTNSTIAQSWIAGLTDISNWLQRLINDVVILLDVFHLTYQEGSVDDPPGTLGTNGEPTWYSAWNDLLDLLGFAAGSRAAPQIKQKIAGAQSTADDAQTNVTQAQNDINAILEPFSNVFDPSAWQDAWNGLMDLLGVQTNAVQAGSGSLKDQQQINDFWNQIVNGLLGRSDQNRGSLDGNGNPDWLQQLWDSLLGIHHDNVVGYGGPENIAGSVQLTWDAIWSGLTGQQASGKSSANVSTQLSDLVSRVAFLENNQNLTQHPNTSPDLTQGDATIEAWVNTIYATGIGGGGGGAGVDGSSHGEGGGAGEWKKIVLTRSAGDFVTGDKLSAYGGAGGDGGDAGIGATRYKEGKDGEPLHIYFRGQNDTLTCPGGSGGRYKVLLNSIWHGDPAYDESFVISGHTRIFHGGGAQTVPSADGNPPGGGGASRNASILNQGGGDGAGGSVGVIFSADQ